MNRRLAGYVLGAALLTSAAGAFGQAPKVDAAPELRVELALEPATEDGAPQVAPTVSIRNAGNTAVIVQHPGNRRTLTFLVTDNLGNVVAPVGRAKVDPAHREITVAPGESFRAKLPRLEFLTGSALFGYDLKTGHSYRVIAVYRPAGEKGPGYSSREAVVTTR